MIAFDADVLIYAADLGNPRGLPVAALFESPVETQPFCGVGSALLVPELLIKPTRRGYQTEVDALVRLLSRLDLRQADRETCKLAYQLGAKYGLGAIDSVHLATAINANCSEFLTNNRKDFSRTITEIEIIYPDNLPLRPSSSK